jgi:hypothetical protein
VNIKEYAQTEEHTQRMAGVLYDLLHTRDLVLYPDDDLRQEMLSAVAVEKESGFRLAKASAGRKTSGQNPLRLSRYTDRRCQWISELSMCADVKNSALRTLNLSSFLSS